MAAKKRAVILFVLGALVASSTAFASIPRSSILEPPALARSPIASGESLPVLSAHDRDAFMTRKSVYEEVARVSKTRVWASRISERLLAQESSELNRALHRAYAEARSENAEEIRDYEIPDLYLAASAESRTKLLSGFKAAPFVETATDLVYLRDRWYDAATGSFITPDPVQFADSSNVYAFAGGDAVNGSDPSGQSATFVGGAIGLAWGTGWAIGSSINDCLFWDQCKGAGHYFSQVGMFTISGAQIGASVDLAAVGGGALSATIGGAGVDSAIAAFSGDWGNYGGAQVRGGAMGFGAWAAFRGVAAIPGVAAAGSWLASTFVVRGGVNLLATAAERTGLTYVGSELARLSFRHGFRTTAKDLAGLGYTPRDFGLNTIADDPRLLGMWNDALRAGTSSRRSNALKTYLDAFDNGGTPSVDSADRAFRYVSGRFLSDARAAGYRIETIHHWNFQRAVFPDEIVNARNLVPTTWPRHRIIHAATATGPNPFNTPIQQRHVLGVGPASWPWRR